MIVLSKQKLLLQILILFCLSIILCGCPGTAPYPGNPRPTRPNPRPNPRPPLTNWVEFPCPDGRIVLLRSDNYF